MIHVARMVVISTALMAVWSGATLRADEPPGASADDPSSKQPSGETFTMTWHAGDPSQRDGLNAGMLRVFEIHLADVPPAGAEKLPTANAKFGIVQFADEGQSRFACGLRETSLDGRKDSSFFIDLNRNGALEDGEVLQGTAVFAGLTAVELGAADLLLGSPDRPRKHRVFVHTNAYGPLYLTSHCYTRGRIRLGDREIEATLLDYNCDGRYASGRVVEEAIGSLGPRESDFDRISWDADGDGQIGMTEQHFIGSYVLSGEKAYRIDCSTDGLSVRVAPLDLPMGRLQMPPGYAYVCLVGPLGPFSVRMPDASVAVPAGTYRVDYAGVWETPQMTGMPKSRKLGMFFQNPWTIRPGATTVIEPSELVVTADDQEQYRARRAARLTVRQEPQVRSLLGTFLDDLKEFKIDLDDAATGRPILLCFFDADQRPSRYCMTQLVLRREELGQKAPVFAAVNASPQSPSSQKWLAEQTFPFALGRIEGDGEQVKTKWGVQSLPWLILADEDHVVRAEGFQLGELDGMLGQTIEVQK